MFTTRFKGISSRYFIFNIDKVIGHILLEKDITFEDKFLTTTGRLMGDCVLKEKKVNIPIIAEVSAALESGIRFAEIY